MTGQPVTAAIVVARFHRPPFLIRAVSILFTFAEKVCFALSWFKERKEFYGLKSLICQVADLRQNVANLKHAVVETYTQ